MLVLVLEVSISSCCGPEVWYLSLRHRSDAALLDMALAPDVVEACSER
jgi:hypothetical protein